MPGRSETEASTALAGLCRAGAPRGRFASKRGLFAELLSSKAAYGGVYQFRKLCLPWMNAPAAVDPDAKIYLCVGSVRLRLSLTLGRTFEEAAK